MPPERSFGKRSLKPLSESLSRSRSTVVAIPSARLISRPKAMFSKTVIQGKSAYSWKTIARSGPGALTGLPKASTVPSSGAMKPAMTLSSVDLPQPDGPSRQTNSPGATSRSMFSKARMACVNCLRTPRMCTAGSGPGTEGGLGPAFVAALCIFDPAVPAKQPIVEPRHAAVDGEADHADGDHAGDDLVGPEVFARFEDSITEAVVDGDHLGHDHADKGDADADAHAGQDRRHGARKQDAAEERGGRGAEVLRDADVDGVDVAHAGDGVHQYREESAQRDEEEGGRVAEAEPED